MQKTPYTLKAKWQSLNLRSKISFALIALVLMLSGLVMLMSYASTDYLVRNYTYELLNSNARLEQRELEIKLSAEIQSAADFADNFITDHVQADVHESALHLVPFLNKQHHAFAATTLTIVDSVGRPMASNLKQMPDYRDNVAFKSMLSAGKPQIQLQRNTNYEPMLVTVLPISQQPTQAITPQAIKGAVVLEIPLKSIVLPSAEKNYFHWLSDRNDVVLAGEKPDLAQVIVSPGYQLQLPIDGVVLHYFLARDHDEALQKIGTLLKLYFVIAFIVLVILLVLAKAIARYLSKPLEHLSSAAHDIAMTSSHARIAIDSKDECGALADAFNTMSSRLAHVYDDLDARVQARTAETEQTMNLLYEAVKSVSHGVCIFDQQDKLLVFNEAYRQYTTLGDFIQEGRTYEEILNKLTTTKTFAIEAGHEQAWVQARMAHHLRADASPLEQQRLDGRWFMVQEVKTPSGHVIGTRIEITELKKLTDALVQRELYLQATLDNLPFLFWLKDKDGRFLAVNKNFSDACGLVTPEDAIGKSDYDVWPEALATLYVADDAEVMATMQEKHIEEPMDASYGTTWIETYKKPVLSRDGQVMGTVGFARDISDRKRTELALAEAELRWSMALRGANDGIWDWNLQTGKVFYSERWKTMLGYADEEISDSPEEWKSRIHADDRERMVSLIEAHLDGRSEFYSGEHRLLCKDGSYKWILTRGKALFDDKGKPIRISGSHTDISEKKIAEDIILDRNQQLDAIFALSADGFVSFDQHHHFKYANPAFYHLVGLEPAQLAGVDEDAFSRLLADQCKENARFVGIAALREKRSMAAATDRSRAHAGETDGQIIELADASNRLLEVSLRLSKASTVSEILYIRDVTYEVEVSRIKSEFLSTAAHELRTPMSSIFGYSELLLTRKFSEQQQQNIYQVIHKQAALVSEILNELLDLQRIESRRGKDFVFARLNIDALINETVAMYKVPDGRNAPQVLLSADSGFIKADRSKMIQVINNVLSNAYKYSPGGGEVVIEAVIHDNVRSNLIGIRIKDHGMGMTPEQLARVCERFYRADTSGSLPGTGLGMSIVKEIVELHHGYVDIKSEHGAGTTVTLWLPADNADEIVTVQ